MAKPRVLSIITKGDLGGAQTHLYDLCRHLQNELDMQIGIGEYGPLYDKLTSLGLTVFVVPSLNRSVSLLNDWLAYRQIIQLMKRCKPDLVATHSSKAGIIGRFAAHRMGIPCVFTAHGWAFTEGIAPLKRDLYRRVESYAARRTDRIICVSDFDKNLALKSGVGNKEKLITIHNGVNDVARTVKSKQNKTVRLIMVARFCQQKDHALLLRAVSEIETDIPFLLQLVGEGPDLQKYKQLVPALGITDRVEFLGPREDVPDLLEESDIFVLSSLWEGFPITILEAMRAGLPVISTDAGGCREAVINTETGLLVPRSDLKALKVSLVSLIENEELRHKMGEAGRIRFQDHFTVNKMVEKTLNVYLEVMKKHGNS